jgi:arabinofuranan 3-O-arabinosyltransferase
MARPVDNPNLSLGLTSSDDVDMNRKFSLPKSQAATGKGSAVPLPSSLLNSLIQTINPVPVGGLVVTASSTLGGLPRFRAENLVDGSRMPWIAEVGDHTPSIDISWQGNRHVDSIRLALSSVAARPIEVSITAGGKRTLIRVPRDGLLTFPSVFTDSVVIRFVQVAKQALSAPNLVEGLRLPVGLSSVSLPGLMTTPVPRPDMNRAFTLSCGHGPPVQLDGKTVQTSTTGTIGALIDLKPIPFTLCTPLSGLRLSAGAHTFEAVDPYGPFEVTSLVLQPAENTDTVRIAPRSVSVQQWGAETRTLKVGAGAATYVVVSQNYNSSWSATMGTHKLTSIRVDGWEQGYLMPAGHAGTVTLSVQTNSLYELLLVLGGLLLVVLVVLALVPSRREESDVAATRTWPNFWLLLALSAAVIAVVAGPLAIMLVPLLVIGRRWGVRVLAFIAFASFIAAGVVAAWQPATLTGSNIGAFGPVAQAASALAFAAVVSSLLADSWAKTDKKNVS